MKVLASVLTLAFAASAFAAAPVQSSNAQIAGKKLQSAVENSLPTTLQADVRNQVRDVRMDIDRLSIDIKQLQDNIGNLPLQYRSALVDKLGDLRAGLAKDYTDASRPTPVASPAPLSGQYCTSSCGNIYSQADTTTMVGARGSNALIASQAASDKLRTVYTCSYAQVAGDCAPVGAKEDAVTCQSACTNIYGQPDTGSAAVANGSNELEAFVNSQVALKAKFSCTNGIAKVKCVTN